MEKLRYYIQWWFEYSLPEFIDRQLPHVMEVERLIPVFVGPRRSGKSTLFFQLIKQLRNTLPLENIFYINYEDDRLLPLDGKELSQLLDVYRQVVKFDVNQSLYLFLDEIQNVPQWEKILRRIHETEKNVRLFVTGSNSQMLGSDLATALRGRTLTFQILPLDFREFLDFKQHRVSDMEGLRYSSQKNQLLFYFDEYLNYGGFPEVVLTEQNTLKEMILKEYIHTIFFADIIQRYNIRNVKLLDSFSKILLRQMGALFSLGKMASSLKSLGYKVSKNTLSEYTNYIESAFLGKSVPIYAYSIKDQLQYPRKFYLVDNGLFRAISFVQDKDRGRLLENSVFIHLFKKYGDLFYWKSREGFEVDFVLPQLFGTPTEFALIQVCYDFTNPTVKNREVRAILKAAQVFKLNKALILTRDVWDEFQLEKVHITVIPFIQWALQI